MLSRTPEGKNTHTKRWGKDNGGDYGTDGRQRIQNSRAGAHTPGSSNTERTTKHEINDKCMERQEHIRLRVSQGSPRPSLTEYKAGRSLGHVTLWIPRERVPLLC